MPTRLRNPRANEGSLVDDPANPKARVMLFKRGGDNSVSKAMKKDGDYEYPASAYAYVPDEEKPSTWKLRLWEDPEKKETAEQVGAAVAALGKGYRGNKVDIPEEDLPKVKAKVRAAWKKVNPDKDDSDMPDAIKKNSRLRKLAESFIPEPIRKMWYAGEGWDLNGDDDKAMQTLIQTLQQDGYSDQVLAVLSAALADTVDSILDDDTVTDKQAQIDAALKEFSDRLQAVGVVKSKGNTNTNREELMQKVRAELDKMFGTTPNGPKEGDSVTIDKNNLPEDVRKYIEGLEEQVSKSATGGTQTEEEILKAALPEPLRKRFEEMEKQAKQAEEIAKRERDERLTREFVAKAESFKGLSVNADDFGKVMKSLAEKAPEEFTKVEELLKSADEAIAKGNLFAEVGKGGGSKTGGAYEQLESIAKSKVEKNKELSYNQAFEQAVSENPNLYSQYREEVSR